MNILTKLDLWLKAEDDIDYKARKRKKQAEELGIEEAACKVAKIRGEAETVDYTDGVFNYVYTDKDLKINYHKESGLGSNSYVRIDYKGEKVYYKSGREPNTFKPCKWIDHLVKEWKDIKKEKEENEKDHKKEKWGIDRECDSKIFNELM